MTRRPVILLLLLSLAFSFTGLARVVHEQHDHAAPHHAHARHLAEPASGPDDATLCPSSPHDHDAPRQRHASCPVCHLFLNLGQALSIAVPPALPALVPLARLTPVPEKEPVHPPMPRAAARDPPQSV